MSLLAFPPAARDWRHELARLRTAAPYLAVMAALGEPATAAAQTLRGSPSSVQRAYDFAKRRDLGFPRTRREVERAARAGTYVRLANGRTYQLRNVQFPYVLPATRAVVVDLAARYSRACGQKMVVTSAIRPTSVRLLNSNPRTVHPTGLAVDLRRPSGRCRAWLREALLRMEKAGTIDATEERFPAHFHLVVYRSP
jgi:hypothetical protein